MYGTNRTTPRGRHAASRLFGRILLGALAALAAGPASAAIDLALELTAPTSYTPGTSVAAAYRLDVIGNTGSDADTPLITTDFPDGVTITQWNCVVQTAAAGTTCGPTISDSGELDISTASVSAGGRLRYTFDVEFAASLADDPLVVEATLDPTGGGNASSDSASSERVQDSELSVVKEASFALYLPGGVGVYTVEVANTGVSDAAGIGVSDLQPEGVTFTNWSCGRSDEQPCSGQLLGGNLTRTITVPAGVTYTYTGTASFDLDVPASVENIATLTLPEGTNDSDSSDDSDSITIGRNPQFDLSLGFTPSGSGLSYIPGSTDNALVLRVTNTGESEASAPVTLVLPSTAVADAQWSCEPATACSDDAGDGSLVTTVTLAADEFVDITFSIDYDSGALVDPLVLEAVLDVDSDTSGPDPVPDTFDKRASNSYEIDRRTDLRITKTVSVETVSPTVGFHYDVRIDNDGPSDIIDGLGEAGLTLVDNFSTDLRGDALECVLSNPLVPCWSYCPDDGGNIDDFDPDTCPVAIVKGSGNISIQAMKLRAGSSSTLRAFVSAAPTALGAVANTASLDPPASPPAEPPPVTETDDGDNSSSVDVTVKLITDISVEKDDGKTIAAAGSTSSYKITVTNSGFYSANNIKVTDDVPLFSGPAGVGFVPGTIRWECRAFDGACCTHNGASNTCGTTTPTTPVLADDLDAAIDLPGRSRVEFTLSGTIDPRSRGDLINTANAELPDGLEDADDENNEASDTTEIVGESGLSLQKRLIALELVDDDPENDENVLYYDLTYEIVVANAGPSRVAAATVSDDLSDTALLETSAEWTCFVVDNPGTTSCSQGTGTGPLSTQVALDAGGRIRFELTVPTEGTPSLPVENTAEITDGDNFADDTIVTPLVGKGDLSVTKTDFVDPPDTVVPGTEHEYVITVSNDGKDDAFGARVIDRLPPEFESATWSCAATTPVPGDLSYFDQQGGSTGGQALVSSADGRHVYVISRGGKSVSTYDRVAVPGLNFGKVSPLETEVEGVNDPQDIGTAVTGLHDPRDLALSPDGTMLFVLSHKLDASAASLTAFNRVANPADPAFGKLSFAGSVSAGVPGDAPGQLEVSNTHVYVSGVVTSGPEPVPQIAVFRRSLSTGLPTLDQTYTTDVPANVGPLALSLPGRRLFAAAGTGSGVASFTISDGSGPTPAGRISAESTNAAASLTGITDLVLAPGGAHLYVMATGSGSVGVLSTQGGLALEPGYTTDGLGITPIGNASFGSGARLALSPDGEHVIVVNGEVETLVQLRRDPTSGGLELDALYPSAEVAAPGLADVSDIEVSPDGRHVFMSSAFAGPGPQQLTVYARRAPDPIFGFLEMDREGDKITANTNLSGLLSPADVAVSPDGRHVYSVSLGDGALVAFERDPRRGGEDASGEHLQHLATYVDGQGGMSGLDRATRLLVSPDGKSVYVSSEDNDTIAVLDRIDVAGTPGFGTLSFRQLLRDGTGGVDGLLGAQGMAMDASSAHLYVAGSFEAAVAVFRRNADLSLTYLGVVKGGSGGATGMGGMRDLVVTADGLNVMGVGSLSNAVVVLRRDAESTSPDFGRLTFRQARTTTGVRLMSIAIPSIKLNPDDTEHVYVVGQDDSSVIVLKRESDLASTAFGTLSTLHEYRGVPGLDGPRDLVIAPDGRRVFVGAQFGGRVLIFDRDRNRTSTGYGGLELLETRIDNADGVDGLNNLYALAVSADSRNVYVAGFGDRAIASFAVGSGSYCSASGSGDIDDSVNIGAGGTVEYRLKVFIRPDATGELCNSVEVEKPVRFEDLDESNNVDEDCSTLQPQGNLSISKTNDQISVVAGSTVRYEVRVDNPGPSNLVHGEDNPLTVSDLLDSNPGFVPGSARWTCLASGSGALDFVQARFDGEPGIERLGGVSDLLSLADADGDGPLPGLLAAASVLDDSLTLFTRDPGDGRLLPGAIAAQGETLGGIPMDSLAGARALAASSDGRYVYVASRVSDSVTAFRIDDAGAGEPTLVLIDVELARVGLDQASHLVLSPDERFLYVAGANDDGIAVFERDTTDGSLEWIESEQNGIDNSNDTAPAVAGLDGVEHLVISPDGEHLYALASGTGTIVRFDRHAEHGFLSWGEAWGSDNLTIELGGAAAAVFDASGEHLYVAVADSNSIVVLGRRSLPSAGNFGELRLLSSVSQEVDGTLGLLSPRRLALSDDGAHLYVTSQGGSSIAWFGRDAFDGSLHYLGLRSAESGGVEGMEGATGLALDDDDNHVYVAGTLAPAVAQFARQNDSSCPSSGNGELDQIPVNIAAGGSIVFTIDVDVESTLAAPLVNTASVASAADPDPSDNSATDTDEPTLLADLRITKDDGLAAYDGLAGARALAGDARHLYVAGSSDNAIGHFVREDADTSPDHGALRFASVARSGEDGVLGIGAVADLVLSADGAHLYAVSPTDSSLVAFTRDPDTGRLAPLDLQRNGVLGVTGLSGARALALSPDGAHVYVVSEFSNALATFTRDANPASPNFGRLGFVGILQNALGGVDGLAQPLAVAVAPDGAHVYTLGGGGSTLAVFRRNPNAGSATYGQLTYLTRYAGAPGGASGLEAAVSFAFDVSGDHLYVLGSAPGTLARFARTAATGELALAERLVQGSADVAGLAGARRVRLSSDGSQLYVAGGSDASLSHFNLDAGGVPSFAGRIANGDPDAGGSLVNGLSGAADVLVAPDGAHVYAASFADAALTGFDRSLEVESFGMLDYRETFFDGLGGVPPGGFVSYRIEVFNAGPAAVPQADVVDLFPAQFVSASWRCIDQSGGGQCVPGEVIGNLQTVVNLPAGARVVFEAVGELGDAVSGTLVNTATVNGRAIVDPDISNNSATDGNTVLSPALDLVASIPAVGGSGVPGGDIEYTVRIANLGPTYATEARVSNVLPPALREMSWSCAATPVAGLLTQTQAIEDAPLTLPQEPVDNLIAALAGVTAIAPSALGLHVYATATLDDVDGVVVFARDPLDGKLTVRQTVRQDRLGVSGILGGRHVVLSSDERFVYVAGTESDAIAVFARDAQTGELSYLTRYQDGEQGIDGLGGVRRLLLAPGGAHLYAAGTLDDAIAVFNVDPSTGLLAPASVVRQAQPGMDGLNGVQDLAWSAGDSHLIAIAQENQSIAAFARNPVTGALTRVALLQDFELPPESVDVLEAPVVLEVNDERVLVGSGNGRIGQFDFDPTAETPAFIPAGNVFDAPAAPSDLLFDPDQARLYVASVADSSVQVYGLLGATPELLDTSPAAGAASLALAPEGRQLYSGGNAITTWARERGSRCAPAGEGGLGPQQVDIAPEGHVEFRLSGLLFANATGELAYEVSVEPRDLGAELQPLDNVARDVRMLQPRPLLGATKSDGLTEVVAGLDLSYTIGLSNDGVSAAVGARVLDAPPIFPTVNAGLFAGSGDWTCAVEPALALLEERSVAGEAALEGIGDLAVSADGTRAYAVSAVRDALLVFSRQPDGALGVLREIRDGDALGDRTVAGLDGASSVAVSSDGRTVVVSAAGANSLVVFGFDPDADTYRFEQKLTSGLDGVAGLLGAEHVVISADDRRVYVAAPGSDAIALFRRDTDTGLLAFVERVRDGLGTISPDSEVIRRVSRLWLSDDGRNLYAIARGQNGANTEAVSSFSIAPDTGVLSFLGVQRRDAIPGLAGVRDLVAAPGDGQIYVLGTATLLRFDRLADGTLALGESLTGIPGLAQARALATNEEGSRLYLLDGGGAVTVYARDWSSGALAYRQRIAAVDPVPAAAARMVHGHAFGELLVSLGDSGVLRRIDERPLSHCVATSGSGDLIDTLVDLDVDGQASFEYAARVHPSARGVLVNEVALIAAAGSDPAAVPGLAQDSTTIIAVSDLSVEKTGPTRAVAGTDIEYQIRVENAGPSDSLGLRVVDTLDAALSDVQWTCVASGTSSCPASGDTTLDMPATLHVGDELLITLTARIAPSFLGALPNRVDIIPEVGATDPSTDDLADETSTEVVAEVDVSVSKDDGVATVIAGTSTTYRIVIANAGPSDATQLAVRDALPAGVDSISFSCVASAGTTCPQDLGQGLNFDQTLPPGESWTIDAVAMIDDAARGQIVNIVSADPPAFVLERDPSDNSAQDIDLIETLTDIGVALHDPLDPFDPAGPIPLPYEVEITNLGPSSATGLTLDLNFGRNVSIAPPQGCTFDGQRMDCAIGTLAAGATRLITLQIGGLPTAPATLFVDALVAAVEPDPAAANNTDLEETELITGADVDVRIDRSTGVVGGEVVVYVVDVQNIGSQAANGFDFELPIPSELIDATWTCAGFGGASCPASGNGDVDEPLSLGSGQRVRFTLTATVDPTIDSSIETYVEVTASALVAPGGDINPVNNTATDRAPVQWGIFRDGFEDPPPARKSILEHHP
jgi:uncharacterized repeat protein (TIGR01451 family)